MCAFSVEMNYQCEKQSRNCFHLFLQLSQINQTVYNISDKDQYCCVLILITNIIHSLIDFVQSFIQYTYILITLMVTIMSTETEAAT